MTGMRWLLLALSTVGTWELIRRRVKVPESFLPMLAAAGQACLLILAGMMGALLPGVILLLAGGLAGLIYSTVRARGRNLKQYFRMEYLFLALGLGIVWIAVRGRVFTHYDNFSHWALVVKKMLEADRFPSAEMTGIIYSGYPMGSTALVYYAARVTGGGEPFWMLAQAYMALVCILPLLSVRGRGSWPGFLLMVCAANFFLCYNIQVTELLVDTLLPLAGMSTLLFVHQRRDRVRESAPRVALLLIWTVQIKGSGIFFGLIAAGVFLYHARRCRCFLPALGWVLAAMATPLIWSWHCGAAYPLEDAAKQSLSASWWQTALRSKSLEDIKHIILELLRYNLQWKDVRYMGLMLAGTAVLSRIFSPQDSCACGKLVLLALLLYLAYQLGLLGMYIFSMTRDEAFYLASVDRYEKTILIAVGYLIAAMGVRVFSEDNPSGAARACAAILLCAGFCVLPGLTGSPRHILDYEPYRIGSFNGLEVREWMEELKRDYDLPEDGDYAILIEDWDSAYFYFLGMYLFPDSDIVLLQEADEVEVGEITADYVLIHDRENPAVQRWVQENYPEQNGNTLINQKGA